LGSTHEIFFDRRPAIGKLHHAHHRPNATFVCDALSLSRSVPAAVRLPHNDSVNGEWVAVRLAMLCADKRGRVRGGRLLHDHAIRVALVVDLALRGRLESGAETNFIDTSATGFGPADLLLRHIDAYPDQPMTRLFRSGPVRLLDVLDPPSNRPGRFGRTSMVTLDPQRVAQVRTAVEQAAETGQAGTQATAALTVLAGVLQMTVDDHQASLLVQCGSVSDLVADCANYLEQLMDRLAVVAALPKADSGSDGG
jgi:hypothetical protein